MAKKTIFNREELLALIKKAKKRVRILGAVSFDLPYKELMKDAKWFERINDGNLTVEIICESESDLTYNSLVSANKKVSGQDRSFDIGHFLRIKNEPKIQVRDELVRNQCKHTEPKGENPKRDETRNPITKFDEVEQEYKTVYDKDEKQCFSLRTCYWCIPVPAINIDDDYYITFSLTKFCTQDKFEKITKQHLWYDEFNKYFQAYFEVELGAKKYSTEITTKGNQKEVILMYNDKRHCLGQLPRLSFLDITKSKLVIWGMIFTRDGKVLIHKRDDNAKDNRGMWDKSIGGHVDMEEDTVDTVKAAAREMLEELYKIEEEDQGQHSASEKKKINPDIPIFLGEWRDEMRQKLPFKEIINNKDTIYFFRMNYDFSKRSVDSPRVLPDGRELPVKCFVDMYIFIMGEDFNEDCNEKRLQNSSYKLFALDELNDCYLGEDITYFNKKSDKEVTEIFKATPDLKKIITGELWGELIKFEGYLKEGLEK